MLKVKKVVNTTYTIEMNQKYADQLDKWLLWAFVVWQQIQYHPQLQDEIFHGLEGTDRAPDTNELSHDSCIVIRQSLQRADVEEI